jgi:hypothetical protein
MVGVPRVIVTLHRVGADTAAPIDSMTADDLGRYEFRFRRTGDQGAMYFVSAAYGGITYFTPPLVHSTVVGDEAEIAVFDTTSSAVPISTRGHHIIVSAADEKSMRTITEVFEVANDSSVTQVVGAGGKSIWSTRLPPGATRFTMTQGDLPGGAVRLENGSAHVYAPIAPGLKQFAFSYALPASSFPIRIPVMRPTEVLEVLIEEEKGSVTGATLAEVDPVSLERRSFRRFMAQDVAPEQVSVIDLPRSAMSRLTGRPFIIALVVVAGGAMAFALARTLRRQ